MPSAFLIFEGYSGRSLLLSSGYSLIFFVGRLESWIMNRSENLRKAGELPTVKCTYVPTLSEDLYT